MGTHSLTQTDTVLKVWAREEMPFAMVSMLAEAKARKCGFGNSLGCVIKGTPIWNHPDGNDVEHYHGMKSGGSWYSAGIIPDKSVSVLGHTAPPKHRCWPQVRGDAALGPCSPRGT